jgi:hypothetical protein
MPPPQLIEYFTAMRSNPPLLKDVMPVVRESGWTDDEIIAAYNTVFKAPSDDVSPTPKQETQLTSNATNLSDSVVFYEPQDTHPIYTPTTIDGSAAIPSTRLVRLRSFSREHLVYAAVGVVALILLAAIAAAGILLPSNKDEKQPTEPAQTQPTQDQQQDDSDNVTDQISITWAEFFWDETKRTAWSLPVTISNNTEGLLFVIIEKQGLDIYFSNDLVMLAGSNTDITEYKLPDTTTTTIFMPSYSNDKPAFGTYSVTITAFACDDLAPETQTQICTIAGLIAGINPFDILESSLTGDNPITPTLEVTKRFDVSSLNQKPREIVDN